MQNTIDNLKNSREETRLFLLSLELEKREKEITRREAELISIKDSLSDDELYRSHEVEFRSQSLASFYNTKMEKDKTLLTLSIATLGFIITCMNSALMISWQTLFIILASVALLYTAYAIIRIFDKNGDYITACVSDQIIDIEELGADLRKLDKRATNSFYLGILLTIALALVSQQKKETEMTKQDSKNNNETLHSIKESYAGASSLRPKPPNETAKEPSNPVKKEDKK